MASTTPIPISRESTMTDFRAPPPSPVASGRRSSVENDEVLTEFLESSLKVPDLVLPDRVFPRQKSVSNPPTLDLHQLASLEKETVLKIVESAAQVGCFQVVNHGVSRHVMESALGDGAEIFRIPPEKRKMVTRSQERNFGFEEDEDPQEWSEDFIWSKDERLVFDLEGVWPSGSPNFRVKLEKLSTEIESVGEKILQFLMDNAQRKCNENGRMMVDENGGGAVCYLKKHYSKEKVEGEEGLRHDVIRTLIRGSQFSHALSLHVPNGCQEFHVYSKKGWTSFHTHHQDALIVTIGDQLQAWSGGQYKHVIGRPVFRGVDADCITLALLYTPRVEKHFQHKTISLPQQVIIVLVLTILYNLWVFFCQK